MADQLQLPVQVVISPEILTGEHNLRDLEIYVGQYVSELVQDLGLPLNVLVRVISAPVPYGPSTFQLLINERPCRMRLWPAANLAGLPVREVACVVSEAFHYCRTSLLTDALSDFIGQKWGVNVESEYRNGWTVGGFKDYLSEFLRRNVSLNRAKPFVDAISPGAATRTDAQLCFEEALEEATRPDFGIRLWLGSELIEHVEDLRPLLEQLTRWAATDPGIALPEISISPSPGLHPDGFRVQINDVSLPEFIAFPSGSKIALASADRLAELKLPSKPVIQPIDALILQVVQTSPEMEATFTNANIALWDQNSFIAWSVSSAANLHAGSMIAAPVTQFLLEKLKRDSPDLIQQVQSRLQKLGFKQSPRVSIIRWTVTAILRLLLDDFVIIRDLRAILEGVLLLSELRSAAQQSRVVAFRTPHAPMFLADGTEQNVTLIEMTQCARSALRALALRYTQLTDDGLTLTSFVLAPAIEQRFMEAGNNLLTQAEIRLLHSSIFNQVSALPPEAVTSILVGQQYRLEVSNCLSVEFPAIPVLGNLEFPPSMKGVVPAGIIDFPPTAPPGP